ncbi:MAG: NUDIX domain-containing protein [Corynebacterium camporealensis]|uniref:NUDIX hydrolase n=1 Tax=Corynebacterium camporealensis TaxID=161896 RepID=UPI002A9185D0|nr:NUDIX domain-containing protein [Corynebacterium camporealensis]MDY5840609.1 NUDIX domain-containing protein [Corynebacterium camporealensis]
MPTPKFITDLREKIGHDQLYLPACSAIIIRPVPEGAPLWEVPTVLLVQRADNGNWAPVEGICEPGEEIGASAVREVKEEVDLDARVEALLGVGSIGPVTYPNGDKCMFMNTAMRLSVADDAEPVISDEENTNVQWCSVAQLPSSVTRQSRLMIGDAVAQMKHPQGFKPRMGFMKRSEMPGR